MFTQPFCAIKIRQTSLVKEHYGIPLNKELIKISMNNHYLSQRFI